MTPPPSAPPADPAAPVDAWARVHASDHVTRYHRLGTGRLVVVLHDAAPEPSAAGAAVTALATRFRAAVPEPPAAGTDFPRWLGGFLDGLGAAPAPLVAFGSRCGDALAFARTDEGRVACLVLAPDDELVARQVQALLAEAELPMPVLVLLPSEAPEAAHARLLGFVDGSP